MGKEERREEGWLGSGLEKRRGERVRKRIGMDYSASYFGGGKFQLVRRMKECSVEGREDILRSMIAARQGGKCAMEACEAASGENVSGEVTREYIERKGKERWRGGGSKNRLIDNAGMILKREVWSICVA